MPDIAIIVPCFNQGHWLSEALNSIQKQTWTNWECIIVDDGSSDNTCDIAEHWCNQSSKFSLIRQANSGLAAARNAGIRQASSPYILPLDADDRIAPQYVEMALQAFKQQQTLSLVYGLAEYFGTVNGYWELKPYTFENLLIENCIYCSAVYRKADWERVGGYYEALRHGLEDWDFWLSILDESSEIFHIDQTVFYYRQHNQSMLNQMKSNGSEIMEAAINAIYCRHLRKYIRTFGHPLDIIRGYRLLVDDKAQWNKSLRYNFGRGVIQWIKKVMK